MSNSKSELLTSFGLKRVQRIYTRQFYTGRRHHITVGWGNSHTQNIQEHQNDFFSAEIHLKITTHSCSWWGPQKDPSLQKQLEEKKCNYKRSLKFSSQLCGKTDGKRSATKGQGATTAVSVFKGGCNMQTAPQLLTVQLGPVNTINILTPVQLGPVKHHQHTKTSTALHKHYQHPNTSTAWHSQTPSRP